MEGPYVQLKAESHSPTILGVKKLAAHLQWKPCFTVAGRRLARQEQIVMEYSEHEVEPG
jgi:hypothetical protein